jgi:hypothetical protein
MRTLSHIRTIVVMKKIQISGKIININISKNEDDYISLTDMAQFKPNSATAMVISHWLSNKNTLIYIGIWESLHNPDFKVTEFRYFETRAGINGFTVSPSHFIKVTGAISIKSSLGRYSKGVFAHKDIAFEFAAWISPEFKLYLIKEFQRLKNEEQKNLSLDWTAKRMLSKINYKIQTDSIHKNIVIPHELTKHQSKFIYASEADLLNVALFGMTAKEWSVRNPEKSGNIRDHADMYQLVCLSNLESINAFLIQNNTSQRDRIIQLNKTAIIQMNILINNKGINQLE